MCPLMTVTLTLTLSAAMTQLHIVLNEALCTRVRQSAMTVHSEECGALLAGPSDEGLEVSSLCDATV